jgi:hypothetical protein
MAIQEILIGQAELSGHRPGKKRRKGKYDCENDLFEIPASMKGLLRYILA